MDKGKRSHIFGFILYPDSVKYDCDEYIKELTDNDYDYVLVFHDKDIKDGFEDSEENDTIPVGETKKAHYHLYIRSKNALYYSSLLKQYPGLNDKTLRPYNDWRKRVRYCAHADNPEKYQYPIDIIQHSEDTEKFNAYFDTDVSQENRIIQIIQHCKENCGESTYETAMYMVANHLWGDFRQIQSLCRDIKTEERQIIENEINRRR